jgi:hypothetical protein
VAVEVVVERVIFAEDGEARSLEIRAWMPGFTSLVRSGGLVSARHREAIKRGRAAGDGA